MEAPEQPQPQVPIMRDGEDNESDEETPVGDDNMMGGGGGNLAFDDGPQSKFVQDARAQMQDQEEQDEQEKVDQDLKSGGGIKMGRIGKRPKKGKGA